MARIIPLFLVTAALANAQQAPGPNVVDLKASDGTLLKATYFPAAKPGPGVLLLHQCNRQRKVWDQLGNQLAAAGISTVTMDLRGFGESGGAARDKLTPVEAARIEVEKWPGDIDVAFDYLTSQKGVDPDAIGVGGASCGVNNSVQTARRHPRQVKSMVLLSGPTNGAGRQFLRQASQLPALFSYADDDEFRDTLDIVPWLYAVDSNPGKKFIHYATGGHGADMFAAHPELRTAIVDWYVMTLIKTPGHAPVDKQPPPVSKWAQALNQLEQPGGVERVAQKVAEARRKDPKAQVFPEGIVNTMGYEHLQSGDIKGAVAILKLNATAYPQSANAFDSLSDAYLADGQKELALENANKALELLATDTKDPEPLRNGIRESARQKLKQLGKEKQ